MPCVFSKPAAPRGIPTSLIIQIIKADLDNRFVCIQYAIICFAIQLKLPWYAFIVELLLAEIAKKFEFLLWDEDFYRRMSVWLETDSPTGEMIVLKIRSMLKNDLINNHNYLFGAVYDFADGHYFLDTNPEHFNDYFGFVCNCMFPNQNVQELESKIFKSRKSLKELCVGISDVVEVHSYPLLPQATIESSEAPRSSAAIVAQNAVTFSLGAPPFVPAPLTRRLYAPVQFFHNPVVPALVPVPQPSVPPPVDEPVLIVHVLSDPPPRNDATDLILAGVKEALQSCVDNAVAMAAESFAAGNRSNVMAITGDQLDAQVLANEVAKSANQEALDAASTASTTLEVVELVTAAADAGEPIFMVSPPDSPSVNALIMSNTHMTGILGLQRGLSDQPLLPEFMEIMEKTSSSIDDILNQIRILRSPPYDAEAVIDSSVSLPSDPFESEHWFCANGAGGPLYMIREEEDGADQSGKTSPHSPDGEVRAHFTTSALFPQQCVEDGALGAQHKSSLSNLGSNPSSGPRRSTHTHELADLLANQPILSLSSYNTAHAKLPSYFLKLASKDVSPQAQTSDEQSGILPYLPPPNLIESSRKAPPPPLKTDLVRRKMNGEGAQSSGNPIGNPPEIVLSHVGVKGNPRADQPSFPSKDDVGGPPVQVLAQSGNSPGNPPGNSGCADHTKSPSSSKLESDSSKVGTNPPASLLKVPNDFGKSRFVRMLLSKSSSPKERNGIGGSPPVAHLSGTMSSESAASTPPLPSSSSPLGGKIGGSPPAHLPGDPPGFVPPPAHSLSSELGSAATTAADPLNEKPPTSWGVKIGGTNSSKYEDIAFRLLKASSEPRVPKMALLAPVA